MAGTKIGTLNDDPETRATVKFSRLLSAVGDLGQELAGQSVINLERVRWTIPGRRLEANRLVVGEGKSIRQAARELGVDKETVRRDLGIVSQKAPKTSQKEPSNELFEEEPFIDPNPQERWERVLSNFASDSATLEGYLDQEFKEWRTYKAPQEVVQLAKQAQSAWKTIIGLIERNLK